ncbi:hypothetical protein [Planktothrix paucivesiculata]|uniref:Uncharacterized protein n=1 Tax=Planktothrix paucivesiculata PCC 9631 TaxID=671071 RepID=A0A7Z9BFZ6_9CYAN|nr:hypothetical protein [Planktothrix paucivesiculata]VXD11860.1 hypothetical protein PL9631_1040049 [Planktothrix paucivesiculata PCC 9631]
MPQLQETSFSLSSLEVISKNLNSPEEEQIINAIHQKINHQPLKTEFLVQQKPR